MIIGNDGEDREQPPIGTVRAICIAVCDLGWQIGFQGSVVRKVLYLWEIDARLKGGEHAGKRHLVSQNFKQSMHEKSAHAQMLESWNARKFTEEERKGHDVEQYINKSCLLGMELSKDGKYVNVGKVLPPIVGTEQIARETPIDYIPDWIKKKIEVGKTKPAVEGQIPLNGIDMPKSELETARNELVRQGKVCKESTLFSQFELDRMIEGMKKNWNDLPSLQFMAKDWAAKHAEKQTAPDGEVLF